MQATQRYLDFINNDYSRALDSLPSAVTTTIESLPPPVPSVTAVNTDVSFTTAAKATVDGPAQPAVKRVRKKRVPKGVVPGVTPPPDPERWLKKSERSTFNQAKRKKGSGGGGATQGSAAMEGISSSTGTVHTTKASGGKGKKRK